MKYFWRHIGKNLYTFQNPFANRSDVHALTEEEITATTDYVVYGKDRKLEFKNVAHWPIHVYDNKNWSYNISMKMLDGIMYSFNASHIDFAATIECMAAIRSKKLNQEFKNKNYFEDEEVCRDLAKKMLHTLCRCGFQQETISYEQLCFENYLKIGKNVAYPLRYIRDYMKSHNLPDLVSIVTTRSGEPIKYYKQFSQSQLRQIRKEVFEFDWINRSIEIN